MAAKFKAKEVTISTDLKFFGTDRGMSSGVSIGATFSIEGVSHDEVEKFIDQTTYDFALHVLEIEFKRGSISKKRMEKMRDYLTEMHSKRGS